MDKDIESQCRKLLHLIMFIVMKKADTIKSFKAFWATIHNIKSEMGNKWNVKSNIQHMKE